MNIRRLVPSDASQLKTLRLQGLQEFPSAFGSSYEEERDTPLAAIESLLAPDSVRTMFGAFLDDRLVASAGIGRETSLKQKHKAFLRGVYVAPDMRGQGTARSLLEFALAYADFLHGVRQVMLVVNSNNAAAIRLYESLGFRSYGCEPGALLVDGVLHDELLMVRMVAQHASTA